MDQKAGYRKLKSRTNNFATGNLQIVTFTYYDHLQNFTYGTSVGVMSVICDVQEYRKCVAVFKVPAVNHLFDTLHAMCNLLIMTPENLRSATQADNLACMDWTILDNWIQLRADYKSKKLGNFL